MEYDIYFEGEYGMVSVTVHAVSATDMLRQLKAAYPDDIGADGFYDDPITGNERALTW